MYRKMIESAEKQVRTFTPKLAMGNYQLQKQDHSKANQWRKRGKSDGRIDFRMGTQSIFNLVRALTKPYVGAHFEYEGEDYKVWRVEPGPGQETNLEPGQVLALNEENHLLVKTGDGSVWIREHELEHLPNISDYLI